VIRPVGKKSELGRWIKKRFKLFRRSLYPLGVELAKLCVASLGRSGYEPWGRLLGFLAFQVLPKERNRAIRQLNLALGEKYEPSAIRKIALECFQSLALSGMECLNMQRMQKHEILGLVEIQGWEHVEQARAKGKGAIFVTGHLGNWELCAVYVALKGFPMNVVARRIYVEELDRQLVSMRQAMGVNTLYRDQSMRLMLRCLERNEFLGILPDQDVRRVGGIFVEFFGRPAYTPVGPALLALASGAPLLLARDIRKAGRHRITVDPPLYANPKAPRQEEVRRLVSLYTKRLEEFIREHPGQWVWMHRRWRTRPS
jgi:KDO2-lipid IV(A) lauroyltransferase